MNSSRRLFSKMAQITILIILVLLAFFLIRGFAKGSLHEKKSVYGLKTNDFSFFIEKPEGGQGLFCLCRKY